MKQIAFESEEDIGYFDYRNSDIEWWKKPSSEHHSGWTSPYFDHDAGQTDMVTYYQPFFKNGIFQGIITVDVSIDLLKNILLLNEEHFEENIPTDIYLFSNDSTLVYADNSILIGRNVLKEFKSYIPEKEINERKIIIDAISGKIGKQKFYSQTLGEERFAFYTPISSTNWHAIAVIPYSFIKESIFEKMWKTIFILIIASIVIMILIYFIARSITKPIEELSLASHLIAEGKYNSNFRIKTKSELGLLANSFNKMSSKLKQREEDLILANEELKVLDDAKTKFLLLISHEIRTPLNGIIGFTDIINDSIDDPEIMEFGSLLKQSVNRLDEFSRKALDITQLQTKYNTLDKSNINVAKTINSILDAKEQDISLKGINVMSSMEEGIIHFGIPEYFTGMIEELIENAIDHSKFNSEVKIKLKKNENGFASFCIKNIGDIIPKEKLSLVLQPFGLAQKHIDQNIGLGLYYVKTYLEIHDAEFDIQSDETGTIFSFVLIS
ncbi:HAMP domain-containing protein [Lentimicrobium sp. S6]|uniref:sensor histidine kinase n=1 Tax=Lentimicrobium sp. S6 TaxID=2735872 RepID=UPI00352F6960